MNDYEKLLQDIETFRKDRNTTDRVQLMKINECVTQLHESILYQKLKDKPAFIKDVQELSDYIDSYVFSIDYLYQFFGCNDMDKIDIKLKVLRRLMDQINKVFSN
jgi:hypothetical protein